MVVAVLRDSIGISSLSCVTARCTLYLHVCWCHGLRLSDLNKETTLLYFTEEPASVYVVSFMATLFVTRDLTFKQTSRCFEVITKEQLQSSNKNSRMLRFFFFYFSQYSTWLLLILMHKILFDFIFRSKLTHHAARFLGYSRASCCRSLLNDCAEMWRKKTTFTVVNRRSNMSGYKC